MKFVFSPDVIFCGWLGLKHQLTKWLTSKKVCPTGSRWVVSACWTIVDWSWPAECSWCMQADLHLEKTKQKKHSRGTIHQAFPQILVYEENHHHYLHKRLKQKLCFFTLKCPHWFYINFVNWIWVIICWVYYSSKVPAVSLVFGLGLYVGHTGSTIAQRYLTPSVATSSLSGVLSGTVCGHTGTTVAQRYLTPSFATSSLSGVWSGTVCATSSLSGVWSGTVCGHTGTTLAQRYLTPSVATSSLSGVCFWDCMWAHWDHFSSEVPDTISCHQQSLWRLVWDCMLAHLHKKGFINWI